MLTFILGVVTGLALLIATSAAMELYDSWQMRKAWRKHARRLTHDR